MINEKVWVEISEQNLIDNLLQFRNRIGETVKLAATVKSNAYGHGFCEVCSVAEKYVDLFAVDSIDEALKLRERGSEKPILILGYTLLSRLEQTVENGFHQVVANLETLRDLGKISARLQKKAFVHLKIETGTSRQGIFVHDLDKYVEIFRQSSLLELAGVSTHFANIEDTTDHSYAENQLKRYKEAVAHLKENGFENFVKHTACSAAAVLFSETHFDLVRVGISMYGLWSSKETKVTATEKNIEMKLNPILTWKTRIAQIKNLPAGTPVSYGCTEKVFIDSKIAILPIGYWDGYDRGLSSVGNVLIRGKRCKVLGRICMNMTIVDVTHLAEVELEDEVVLLGRQENEEITAEELAGKMNTINYEVVTRINPLVKRFVR
ncbi:alanine racemase [Patescibacteria group bacterium]|nr:alanine racemase [Patescibacteria group bacterium]